MGKIYPVQCLLLMILVINCSKESDKIIAKVNDEFISASKFKVSYSQFLENNLLSDNLLNRYAFINNLIDEILFVEYATDINIDSDSIFLENKSKIYDQLLLNDYFEKEIESDFKINETESRQLFSWDNTSLHVRHLFSKDSNKIKKIHEDLSNGGSWELIARESFRDSTLKNNGGDLGWIKLGDSDPFFEFAAFSMDIGSVSKPVRIRTGYSIIQLLDKTYETFLSEKDYLNSKSDMTRLAKYYKKQFKIREYMDSIQKELNIKFSENVFNELYKTIFFFNGGKDIKLNEKLLIFKDGSWDLEMAIRSLSELSNDQLGRIETESDLKDAIKGLIVRSHFLKDAKELGFDKRLRFKDAYKKLVNRDKVKFVLDAINTDNDIDNPDYEKQKKLKYFNFRKELSKQSEVYIDSLLLKTMVLS